MRIDLGGIEVEASAATRAAVLDHLDAFNAHDTDRLIAGLHHDVVWTTGSDVFRGSSQLQADLFDEGLWATRPSLAVRTLLVEGEAAAGTFHEALVVNDNNGEAIPITASFGVAGWKVGEGVEAVVDRADRAMYASKAAGRNRVTSAED